MGIHKERSMVDFNPAPRKDMKPHIGHRRNCAQTNALRTLAASEVTRSDTHPKNSMDGEYHGLVVWPTLSNFATEPLDLPYSAARRGSIKDAIAESMTELSEPRLGEVLAKTLSPWATQRRYFA